MDLISLREQIDAIDTKIVELYKERMEVCKNVGIEKAKSSMRSPSISPVLVDMPIQPIIASMKITAKNISENLLS